MSDLDDVIEVNISRSTVSVSIASFDIPAIISEFEATKTTPTFGRAKVYGGLDEMVAEGFSTTDAEYIAASKILSQQPSIQNFVLGRKSDVDADWTTALNAIQTELSDWYTFSIVYGSISKVVFDADFVTANQIDGEVSGTTLDPVIFDTDQVTTMNALIAEIQLKRPNSSVILDTTDPTNRTLLISEYGIQDTNPSFTVTLGASQPTATVTTEEDEAAIKEAMAWSETQTKIYFYSSSNSGIPIPATTDDIFSFAQDNTYDRTVQTFYKDDSRSYIEYAVPGRFLPVDPGGTSWTYKPLSGIVPNDLTTSEISGIKGKNGNIYITRVSVNGWEEGIVASGENIFAIRGLDWLEARLQQAIFALLSGVQKVPFDDGGIQTVGGIVEGVLKEAERAGVLVDGSSVVTLPVFADIDPVDKQAGILSGIEFTALLEGAIKKVVINGTVSY